MAPMKVPVITYKLQTKGGEMLNKALLIGRLGADPELRHTGQGTPVANLTVATNRRWRDNEGERQEDTQWHKIVVFGKQAENVAQYLEKGSLVHVEGRIQTRNWKDKNDIERKTTEIVARNVTFLDKQSSGGEPSQMGEEKENAASEDDVPF